MISFNDRTAGEDAENLANYLTANGIPTFCTRLFCQSLAGSWRPPTVLGVNTCKYYIPLMNKGWFNSKECQYETSIAEGRRATEGLIVLPVDYGYIPKKKSKEALNYSELWKSIQMHKRKPMRNQDTWMKNIENAIKSKHTEMKLNQKKRSQKNLLMLSIGFSLVLASTFTALKVMGVLNNELPSIQPSSVPSPKPSQIPSHQPSFLPSSAPTTEWQSISLQSWKEVVDQQTFKNYTAFDLAKQWCLNKENHRGDFAFQKEILKVGIIIIIQFKYCILLEF